MRQLGTDVDPDTLLQTEWVELTTTWGTTAVDEIQTMLLLEESVTRQVTLLARTLYYTGLVGITPVWSRITGMQTPDSRRGWGQLVGIRADDNEDELITKNTRLLHTLRGFMHASLHQYWTGAADLCKFHIALAAAIQLAVAGGFTCTAQFQCQSSKYWTVPLAAMPDTALEALLIALKGSVPGSKRLSVAGTMTADQATSIFKQRAPSPSGFRMEDDEDEDDSADFFALGLMEGAEPEAAASPTNALPGRPRKDSGSQEAALSRGQTRLTSWLQQRQQEARESWLPEQQPAPATVEHRNP
eukprot:1997037-Rhodomonas_salina.1